jgi:hypothetical protein
MSSDEPLLEIFDVEQARETIIDFIQTHPEWTREKFLKEQNKIGKKKLNSILPDLIKEGIIEEVKSSGKKRPLIVKAANPYTVVLNELKSFEKIYFSILNKTIEACNKGRYLGDYTKPSCDSNVQRLAKAGSAVALIWQPIHIFYEFLELYMIKLITNWSKEIREKDVLQKVNNMIFAKFTQMRIDTYNKMKSAAGEVGYASIIISYVKVQMKTMYRLNEILKTLKKYGIEKEAKELSEFIDKVVATEETRSYFRSKQKLYRWGSEYKDADLKELAEDTYRHRDENYYGYYSDNTH